MRGGGRRRSGKQKLRVGEAMEATVTTHIQRQARKIDLSYDCKNDSGLVFLGSFWQLMESLKDEMKFN